MELWGAGAVFTLTKYSDTNGSEVMLIKDWRDLFNQVSVVGFTLLVHSDIFVSLSTERN